MIFRRAVTRLTLAFTGIFLVLFAGFALGIYAFVNATFDFDAVQQDGAHVGDVVDAASHELRTPLGVMMGESEYSLLRNRTGAESWRSMVAALGAVDGMARLTDQLLALTRGDVRDLRSSFERVALGDAAERAWASLPADLT